ncbi:MAG: glycosyltransferase family 39 protein, partial [Halobacteria archaeon]|nr:glycosyltransferase family 39 protein [Halobacteria archaeon]
MKNYLVEEILTPVNERLRPEKETAITVLLSLVVGISVFLIATEIFPYHTSNHDEGVYLQQAEMLLDGQLFMYPGELADAFRTWFFVVDGGKMYPKYSPVPAVVFGLGKLIGSFRLSLAVVGALNAFLVYLIATEAFDRKVGVASVVALALSPFFLVQSSVFLPYAPTTFFNLMFAFSYVRSLRTQGRSARRVYSSLAGISIGIAFFSRPYTAFLFALPFIVHALYTLAKSLEDRRQAVEAIKNYSLISFFGVAFVGITLAYNAVMTGSPFLFPYLVFAPNDGLGFGRHSLLGHSRVYDIETAIRANYYVLRYFILYWFSGGLVGVLLLGVGLTS